MRATAHLAVKGVGYYDGVALFNHGALTRGLPIQLKHEVDNPHDNNAISVRLKSSGEMLGHLSKELAPKYAALVDDGRILEACVNGIELNGKYLNIEIKVVYEQPEEELTARHNSRLWVSSTAVPNGPGVYAIRNVQSGRQYIGSSINIRNRIRSHIKDLLAGCHTNHALQSDFSALGATNFEAKTLAKDVPESRLNLIETQHIKLSLDSGDALYNLTFDGRGTGHKSRGLVQLQPVSEQLAKRQAEEEKLRIEQIRFRKKQAVADDFDKKLAQLVPQGEFSRYFSASFLSSLIVLAILFPGIGASAVLMLSIIMALFAALTINGHYQGKAKQSPQYQKLLHERESALSKIDNDPT